VKKLNKKFLKILEITCIQRVFNFEDKCKNLRKSYSIPLCSCLNFFDQVIHFCKFACADSIIACISRLQTLWIKTAAFIRVSEGVHEELYFFKSPPPPLKAEEQGVCHTGPLPFTFKNILRQKKKYRNSNISPCKNIPYPKLSFVIK